MTKPEIASAREDWQPHAVKRGDQVMAFEAITAIEMQAAQILTGATMVAWMAARYAGGNARRIRQAVLGLYLVGVVAFVLYVLVR